MCLKKRTEPTKNTQSKRPKQTKKPLWRVPGIKAGKDNLTFVISVRNLIVQKEAAFSRN